MRVLAHVKSTNIDEAVVTSADEIKETAKPVEEDDGDVIMISDSDDELAKDTPKPEAKAEETAKKSDPNLNGKDVQQMLDEMMVQTMKAVEEQPEEIDSDLSGTEKVEEVVCKEEKQEEKVETKNKEKSEIQKKKSQEKHSESATDTDKTSMDDDSSSSSSSSSSVSSSDSDSDDSSSSASSSSTGTNNENMSNNEILSLVDRCITGLEICLIRLSQNYKALYRLAHLYFYYKPKKDVTKCNQLLLGEYKCKNGTVITGLFSDRKINNLFNGIWRIPSTEIDRPGSLSAHMSRCISLLLQILRNTDDNKTLIELCMQLRKNSLT
ncbi:hypothetical protein NQ317_010316 [Molorchus minor]|uniref:Uncharacterized protein n=1 Tax=Molorchus minor TaxID=1323400 RepID=A0ABQ9IYR1_9CUCU|nr:hypothetical protein NQ317_010316 [Molorchus minor]